VLPRRANHLFAVPGDERWTFVEKDSALGLDDQEHSSFSLWIRDCSRHLLPLSVGRLRVPQEGSAIEEEAALPGGLLTRRRSGTREQHGDRGCQLLEVPEDVHHQVRRAGRGVLDSERARAVEGEREDGVVGAHLPGPKLIVLGGPAA